MEKVRNLSLRKSILLYMAVGILAGFLLGAIAGNEAGRIQEQIWWKYVDQDRYIEEFLKRDEESFDVVIPRVSNSRMSDWDARFSEWCDFLQTYGILVMCAGGIIVSTMLFYQKKIRKPLGTLRMAAEKIAGNDLDFEIGYENRDEVGELCLEFDRMKNQLTQNNRKMWRMVEDEQVLRAAIAHDIRTPLTVLKGYQEMMLEFLPGETLDRETLLHMLCESMGQIERLERFLERMRAFSALEQQPLSCQPQTVEKLSEEIQKVGEILSREAKREFQIFAGGKGKTLFLDRDLILEVADNLIGNGLRFAKRQVIVCVLEEESGLTLEVKDDGTGFDISEERAKQAFTTSGLRDDLKHFGLGMYISELYCKKHDGFLTVENQSGGACVRAYFRSIVPESVVPETEAF